MQPSRHPGVQPLEPVTQRRLIRGSAAYLLTSVIQRAASFVLLPIYANILVPAEFGQIGIATTVAAAVGAVLGLGIETAVFRQLVLLRDDPREAARFLNTIGLFGIVGPMGGALLVAWPAAMLVSAQFAVPPLATALALVTAGATASATSVCFAVLRAKERLGGYIALGLVQVVLVIGLPLLFVVAVDGGVTGWFGGTALGTVLVLTIGLAMVGHRFTMTIRRSYVATALAFGIPLIPHALSQWGLALSDRVVLGAFVDAGVVGVYHVAYQFGLPIALFATALAQSAQPLYAEASAADQQRLADIRRLSTYALVAIAFVATSIAVLGPPLMQMVLPAEYHDGALLIPWIAIGTGLLGCYFVPMNVITVHVGQARWVWVITGIAAAVNVALNVVLIPRFGAVAASIDTAVGYAVLLVGVAWYARRVAPHVSYEMARIAAGVAITVLSMALLIVTDDPLRTLLVRTVGVGLVLSALFVFRLLPRSALAHVIASSPWGRPAKERA